MLNLLEIQKKVYQQINDDPTGNGAYSLEEMNDFIKIGSQMFFKESRAIQIKTLVDEKAFLQGLVEIIKFEDERGNKIKPQYTAVGEQLSLISPKKAYIVWAYGGFELITTDGNSPNAHDIRHSISLNTIAMTVIIHYILSLIYEKELDFTTSKRFEEKAKEGSLKFRKSFNTSYIIGDYYGTTNRHMVGRHYREQCQKLQ